MPGMEQQPQGQPQPGPEQLIEGLQSTGEMFSQLAQGAPPEIAEIANGIVQGIEKILSIVSGGGAPAANQPADAQGRSGVVPADQPSADGVRPVPA